MDVLEVDFVGWPVIWLEEKGLLICSFRMTPFSFEDDKEGFGT